MSLYSIQTEDRTTTIKLSVVSTVQNSNNNSVIVYEAAGGDGGFILNTGRLNKQIVISGKLLSSLKNSGTITVFEDDVYNDLSQKIETIETLKDNAEPVIFNRPITGNSKGVYIIKGFSYTLVEGQVKYVLFTLTLEEYRPASDRTSQVANLQSQAIQQYTEVYTNQVNLNS